MSKEIEVTVKRDGELFDSSSGGWIPLYVVTYDRESIRFIARSESEVASRVRSAISYHRARVVELSLKNGSGTKFKVQIDE